MPYIYCLKDPSTGEVRYVGQTTNAERRHRSHATSGKEWGSLTEMWVHSLMGASPEMEILEEVSLDDADASEKRWIAHYAAQGCLMVNTQHLPAGSGQWKPKVQMRPGSIEQGIDTIFFRLFGQHLVDIIRRLTEKGWSIREISDAIGVDQMTLKTCAERHGAREATVFIWPDPETNSNDSQT